MKKGFTLIELLAVIVILAIIALIATPIILGIINDAREKANERSVELYAAAVKNSVAAYQLINANAPTKFSDLNVDYDGDVKCEVQELYENGSFYLDKCKVNNGDKEYSYGVQITTQISTTRYYSWSSGKVGELLPDDAEEKLSDLDTRGWDVFLALDANDSNNEIVAAYVCLDTIHCLKALDKNAYNTNKNLIEDFFSDEFFPDLEEICSFDEKNSYCGYETFVSASASSNGEVSASNNHGYCGVNTLGYFECIDALNN